jgi:hypothetical protein
MIRSELQAQSYKLKAARDKHEEMKRSLMSKTSPRAACVLKLASYSSYLIMNS